MIICFSGLGNTRYAAVKLKNSLGDEVLRVAPGFYRRPETFRVVVPDGRVIWAFPTHSWGIPKYARIIMENCEIVSEDNKPLKHYMVTTCGDDIGLCADLWRKVMKKRGFTTMSAFSVQMPNTYTFMRGFDVDKPDVVQKKFECCDQSLEEIAEIIKSGKPHNDKVVKGSFPWIKTKIVHPWFMKFCVNPKKFSVDNTKCQHCGKCAHLCPLANISIDATTQLPVWGDVCTLCTRCYHVCPNHAIDYDNSSSKKGQYLHPIFSKNHRNTQ